MINESSRLASNEYQVYAVLSMCRYLFFFTHNEVVSKKVAAKWAQSKFSKWEALIEEALDWTIGQNMDQLDKIKEFIRFTINFIETKEKDK